MRHFAKADLNETFLFPTDAVFKSIRPNILNSEPITMFVYKNIHVEVPCVTLLT